MIKWAVILQELKYLEGSPQFAGVREKNATRQTSRGPTVRLGRKPRHSGSVTNGIVIVKKLEGQ